MQKDPWKLVNTLVALLSNLPEDLHLLLTFISLERAHAAEHSILFPRIGEYLKEILSCFLCQHDYELPVCK